VPPTVLARTVEFIDAVTKWGLKGQGIAELSQSAARFAQKVRALKMGTWSEPVVGNCLADLVIDAKVLW